MVEAIANTQNASASIPEKKPFEELWKKKTYVLILSAAVISFWLLNFAYLDFTVSPNQVERSLILSSAFSGTILIAISLLIGPLARLFPKFNYIPHRRGIGVWGFLLVWIHGFLVFAQVFKFDAAAILFELNPLKNPILFGYAASILLFPLALTSTDWAMKKMGKYWKLLHRLVYPAFIFAVCHFLLINPKLFDNVSKGALTILTIAVFVLELIAFFKTIGKTKSLPSIAYGSALIIAGGALLIVAYLSAYRI